MKQQKVLSALASDTIKGLSSNPKYLLSKYFYDDTGSAIFQDIMKMPEYYLTRCEEEIFTIHKESIAEAIYRGNTSFSLVELGSGDGQKTKIMLKHLTRLQIPFQYIPLDISQKANNLLCRTLEREIPGIEIHARTGDYFTQLRELNGFASVRKIIFFLGSNIGNFSEEETQGFLNQLSSFTQRGDKLLIGFDLKKSPKVIMDAYSDPHGHTRNFNLNLLVRLNRELHANFDINRFEHHSEYNPQNGEVKSFLISNGNQQVDVRQIEQSFLFDKWEPVFMERSRKYDLDAIDRLAAEHGFKVEAHFTDKQKYFVDSLWEKM